MKKSIIILFVFFSMLIIPFITNAEECNNDRVTIQSISIKDKSEYVEELSDATFKDNKLNLDLKMYDVGDYIEYELKVKNESNEDFSLNKDFLKIDSDYFDYSISFPDDSNKIKPNQEKTIFLKVEYKKEVEKENFFSGKYVSNNTVTLKSINNSNDNTNSNSITNPLTNNNKLTLFLFILLIVQFILYFTRDKRIHKTMILLIGILLPLEVCAACNFELDINSNITIGKVKPNPCTYDGELVQGAEYTDAQFTYRFQQQPSAFGYDNYMEWSNNDNDGWAVTLTDRESTDDITTKICSTINGKPVNLAAHLFFSSKARNIIVSDWDTTNFSDISYMFNDTKNVETLDLSNWNLANVTTMNNLFFNNKSLKQIDFSNVDVSRIESLKRVFVSNPLLEEIKLDHWNTENALTMEDMFSNNSSLRTLDLSSFDTRNTTNMVNMFGGDSSLKTVSVSDTFVINDGAYSIGMFFNCFSLIGGNGTVYDSNHIDREYARIDAPGSPGYFTRAN